LWLAYSNDLTFDLAVMRVAEPLVGVPADFVGAVVELAANK